MIDFQILFENSPSSILVLNPQYTIVGVTNNYLVDTMTDRSIIGKNLFEVFPGNPADDGVEVNNLKNSLDTVVKTKLPHRMAYQKYDITNKDGVLEEHWWNPYNIPIIKDGEVLYIMHEVVEVTELVALRKKVLQDDERIKRLCELTKQLTEQFSAK